MKYITLLLLTSFSASLFSSDGGSSEAEWRGKSAVKNSFALDHQIVPHLNRHSLTLDIVQAFCKRTSSSHDADSSFCKTYGNIIQDYAAATQASKSPTFDEIEHACASLLLLEFLESDRVAKELLDGKAEAVLKAHGDYITNLVTIAETASDISSIRTGLRALDLIEALFDGDNATQYIGEKRPLLQKQLAAVEARKGLEKKDKKTGDDDKQKSKITLIDDEEFGAPAPTSWWSNAFSRKGLITIGGIALIAAAVYYFGYAKKDAKTAKGNPQPKK